MAKILSISIENQHDQAELLYEAACAVFASLPPAHLLTHFNQAEYDAWYDANFEDSSDGWNSGASLYIMSVRPGVRIEDFILITPTSGRTVKVMVQGERIWSCGVLFASGSIQAAGDIILACQRQPERMGDIHKVPAISVSFVDEGGDIRARSIREIGVEDAPVSKRIWELPERKIVVL